MVNMALQNDLKSLHYRMSENLWLRHYFSSVYYHSNERDEIELLGYKACSDRLNERTPPSPTHTEPK